MKLGKIQADFNAGLLEPRGTEHADFKLCSKVVRMTCPCTQELDMADAIITSVNHHEELVEYAKKLQAIWKESKPGSKSLGALNKLLKELK